MNPDRSPDDPTSSDGAMTATGGTPVAVDVSRDRRARATIAQVVAGPVIWSVYFMLVYLVVEAGCTGEGRGLAAFDPPVPTIVTLGATAVAVLACLGSAWWAYRRWRIGQRVAANGAEDPGGHDQHDRGELLALAGVLLSLLGVVTVLFIGLPALVLPAC